MNLDLTARQRVLLELLGREGRLSPQDIMGRLKRHPVGDDVGELTRRVLQREMQLLRDLSLIDFTGRGPGVRWFLVDAPPRAELGCRTRRVTTEDSVHRRPPPGAIGAILVQSVHLGAIPLGDRPKHRTAAYRRTRVRMPVFIDPPGAAPPRGAS